MEPSELVEAIREALRRTGSNPSRFAKDHGFSVNAIRYILEGRPPSSRRLAEVCDALGLEFYVGPPRLPAGSRLDAKQLAAELERLAQEARRLAEEPAEASGESHPGSPYISAPRFDILAAAGGGSPMGEEVITGYLGFTKEWMRSQQLMVEKIAVIEVNGDSMEPTLHDGDTVLLDLRPPEPRDGDIFTLRRGDELLVKRLRRQEAGWLIVSDNIAYPVESVDDSVSLVGRVVWVGRTFQRGR